MKLDLKQKKLFAGERQFRFRDKTTLNVICKTLKTHNEYLIDVVALDPVIKNNFVFAKKSLISFIIFLFLSLIIYSLPALELLPLQYKNWAVSLTTVFSLISFIFFLVFTSREKVFVSRHTQVPLVRLYNDLPNKKEFKNFIETIQRQSQQRFEHLGLNLQQQRAGELKTMRRVHGQGGITAHQYEKAKNKLLNVPG